MNNNTKTGSIKTKEDMFNLSIKRAKNTREAVSLLLKKRGEHLDKKSLDGEHKDKYEEYTTPILGFKHKKFALKTGHIATISDPHGDYFAMYGFFVQIGYLIPLEDEFFVAYIRSENYKNKKNKIEYVFLKEVDLSDLKTKVNLIVILPGFCENKDFEGKTKMLGDYIDRGPESLACMLLLDYLTKKEKERLGEQYDQCNGKRLLSVCAGNHELTVPNKDNFRALRLVDPLIKNLIHNMISDGRMIFSDLEMINEISVSFSHASMCRLHIYKILGIIMTFYKLGYLDVITCKRLVRDKSGKKTISEVKIKIEGSEVLKKVKQNFLSLKTKKKYLDLFSKLEKDLIPECKGKNCYELSILYGLVMQAKNDNEKNCDIAYNSLKVNYKLEDVDYFKLRDFIVYVLPPDLYFDLYKTGLLVFYDERKTDQETYFQSLDGYSSYWPLEERYVAPREKYFNVLQYVGHDASGLDTKTQKYLYDRLNPYIKNTNGNDSEPVVNDAKNVISLDTLASVGYHSKNYVSGVDKKYSDSLVFIITSNLKFLIDKYSVERDDEFEILPDTVKRKEGFISLGQNGSTRIKSQKTDLVKKFASFKRFLGAYSNIKVENKPEEQKDIDMENSINNKQENSVDYGYDSDFISVDEDSEKNVTSESSNKKGIIGNPETHYENNNMTHNNNKISNISKDNSNENLNVHINNVSKENKSTDFEDGKIQTKTPMTPDETLKYFKSKIGDESRPRNNQLTSEDIDEILQDFDGKTDYESLYFFTSSCGKHTLSKENFHKLMKYYNDITESKLLLSIALILNFFIDENDALKLFGNITEIDKSGISLSLITRFWRKGGKPIEVRDGNFVNNIIRHLYTGQYKVLIFSLKVFFKMFNVKGILGKEEVDVLDKLNISDNLGFSYVFQTYDFIKLCAAFKKGTLSKKIGDKAISALRFSSTKFKESIIYYRITERDIKTIVEAFKKDAQDYIRDKLEEYKRKIDERLENFYYGYHGYKEMCSSERNRSRSRDREEYSDKSESSERSYKREREEKYKDNRYKNERNKRRPRNNDYDCNRQNYKGHY